MATAMTAGAAATGLRAWLGAHRPRWMSARRLKVVTGAILAVGVLAAGSQLAPSGSAASEDDAPAGAVAR
ncbi:MAG TPA: hypothetical protein VGV34_03595 [Solirubrobacterales bacterium]|nr:hypothetical protein [Solirubrobacterales bacterium]